MNFKHPPFDNVKIRQAALMALSQEDVLSTLIGNPDYYTVCGAIYGCGRREYSRCAPDGVPLRKHSVLAAAGADRVGTLI